MPPFPLLKKADVLRLFPLDLLAHLELKHPLGPAVPGTVFSFLHVVQDCARRSSRLWMVSSRVRQVSPLRMKYEQSFLAFSALPVSPFPNFTLRPVNPRLLPFVFFRQLAIALPDRLVDPSNTYVALEASAPFELAPAFLSLSRAGGPAAFLRPLPFPLLRKMRRCEVGQSSAHGKIETPMKTLPPRVRLFFSLHAPVRGPFQEPSQQNVSALFCPRVCLTTPRTLCRSFFSQQLSFFCR